MTWYTTNFHNTAEMDTPNRVRPFRKTVVFMLILLLAQLGCSTQSVSECCRQPAQSCRLQVLLCRSGKKSIGGTIAGDAAAGILTLGKRNEDELHLQSRLHQLLHGRKNQAAGILTMGKRTAQRDREQ
ncbi:orexin isoform X1 [Xiphophorus maculatus]|uniref:Hypocretin neuropeptide precursor n=1 Tax=Xiphophorus maculatus TaxID=8083 RepID=M4A3E2_XIPMA|nr:orexin isoform X1 [Xiphophorus maculatus]